MPILRTLILIFLFLLASGKVFAQELVFDEETFKNIASVIRHETIFSKEPGTLSTLTAQDLEILNPQDLTWVLRYLPGVLLNYTSPSYANIMFRGATGVFPPIQVLLDGRPYTIEAIGITVWPFLLIDPSEIERIELISTPASVYFGSNALTGAINIVTKPPEDIHKNSIQTSLGTQSYFKTAGIFKKYIKPWHVYAFIGQEKVDDFHSSNLSMRRCMARTSLSRITRLGTLRFDIGFYSGELKNLYILRNLSESFGLFDFGIDTDDVHHWGARLALEGPTYFIRFSNYQADGELVITNTLNQPIKYKQKDYLLEAEKYLYFYKQRLTIGFNLQQVNTNTDFIKDSDETRFALFAEDLIKLNKKIDLNLGARINYHPLTNFYFSPRASFVFSLRPNIKLRYTYTRSFGNPILYYTSINLKNYPIKIPNYPIDFKLTIEPTKKPEYIKQDAHEVSLLIKKKKHSLLLSMFNYYIKDYPYQKIEQINQITGTINVSSGYLKRKIKGFSIEYQYHIFNNFSLRTNYEYTDVKNLTTNRKEKIFPRHLISGLILYKRKKFSGFIGVNYISKREDSNVKIGDIFYLDTGINFKLSKKFSVSIQGLNILNCQEKNDIFGKELERRLFLNLKYQW
ncbi:TonB-dependent receptor plug domain-containing protein [Thermodesulfatator indicus]